VVLRSPQFVRILCAVDFGDRTVRENYFLVTRLPLWSEVGRATGDDSRVTLDHHLADVVVGAPDQSNPATRILLRLLQDPLRTSPSLAPAASGQDQPDIPKPLWSPLVFTSPEWPMPLQDPTLKFCEGFEKSLPERG